ncbi:MAG: helicase-associated domain-containing protein [Chloroflexota bacterium]
MSDHSLERLLTDTHRDVLHALARAQQFAEPMPKKVELVKQLAQHLRQPQRIQQALVALSPDAARIFARVRDGGGSAYSLTLMGELAREGGSQRGRPSDHGALDKASFGDAVWCLLQHGLLLSVTSRWLAPTPDHLTQFNTQLVIPSEVLATLSDTHRLLRVVRDDAIAQTDDGSAQNFQRDVYLYWNYLRDQSVTLTTLGFVPKRHLAKLNNAMLAKTDIKAARDESHMGRLHFIRVLLEEGGLVKRSEARLAPSPNAHDFFGYTITRRSDRLFEAWKRTTRWNELLRLPIRPRLHEARSAKALHVVARARQSVLSFIATHAADGWLDVAALTQRMREQHYEFLFKRTHPEYGEVNPYYYFHNPLGWGFPVGDEREGWDLVEGEFIRSIIREPLHWLGLVSLGYMDGALTAFKLTPLGAYLFELTTQAPDVESVAALGRLVVQPNFQVFALEPIAEQTLASLDRLADRVKADKVFEYQLTRESLYRAQQAGIATRDVIAFLADAATAPLPQNVERTLEEWGQSYERIIVRKNVSLLHALDPQTLDLLDADPDLLSRPLPRVAVVRGESAARERLAQALWAHGQLPAYAHQHAEAQHALTLADDGKITLLHPLPDIFLLQQLEQHSERRANGYHLTAAVVRREARDGASAEQIIARWERWHHGPLVSGVVEKIRKWAG